MEWKTVFDLAENYEKYGLFCEVEDGKIARTGIDKVEGTEK